MRRFVGHVDVIDRVLAAVGALVVALTAVVYAVAGHKVVAIVPAVAGLCVALAIFAIKLLAERARHRARWADLFDPTPPPRLAEAQQNETFYEIGVGAEPAEALSRIENCPRHAPYVVRDVDAGLRPVLLAAIDQPGTWLIILSGDPGAGRSRTLLEAAASAAGAATLLVPRDLAALNRLPSVTPLEDGPCVIWLDDIEDWAHDVRDGVNRRWLNALSRWNRPVVVLAAEGRRDARTDQTHTGQSEAVSTLVATAHWHESLGTGLTRAELARARTSLGTAAATALEAESIGGFLTPRFRLIRRVEAAPSALHSAFVHAAIDLVRTGIAGYVTAQVLYGLCRFYVQYEPSDDELRHALQWATDPAYANKALVEATMNGAEYRYRAQLNLADYYARRGDPVPAALWERIINHYKLADQELLAVSAAADAVGETLWARMAAEKSAAAGSINGTFQLAKLVEKSDPTRAVRLYDGVSRHHGELAARAAIRLAELHATDHAQALNFYQRAIDTDDPELAPRAAIALGALIGRTDVRAAEHAYRFAIQSGHVEYAPEAEYHRGELLASSDPDRARLAFRRAQESNHPVWSVAADAALGEADTTRVGNPIVARARATRSAVALVVITVCVLVITVVVLISRGSDAHRQLSHSTSSVPQSKSPASPVPHSFAGLPNPTSRDSRGYNIGRGCSDDPQAPSLPGCSDAPTIPQGHVRKDCPSTIVVDASTTTCHLGDALRAAFVRDGMVTARSLNTGRDYTFLCLTGGTGTSGETICEATGRHGELLYARW